MTSVSRIINNVILSALIFLNVGTAQTSTEHASTDVENEAFDPGYGHRVNIGVKSQSQQNNKSLRAILYSKTY